jgi:3-oxosteroid 1-dehydrogenase
MSDLESRIAESASERVDVLVVGSGAAGLVSALAAASCGCRVRIVEKTPWLGGTTALSQGMIWVPAGAASPGLDSPADGLAYLRASAEGKLDESRAGAYVQNAVAMLSFIEAESLARYELARSSPDYYGTLAGATVGLRA